MSLQQNLPIKKAMLLAAGRGERLRPLTTTTPKALIEIGGKPLIYYHLEKLAKANITNIVINVSHLADKIIDALGDGSPWGVNITYSKEEPEPLETGGGIYKALPLLGDAPFLVLSTDIFTDYNFQHLPKTLAPNTLAYLVVTKSAFHSNNDFHWQSNSSLLLNSGTPSFTYANIAILHPDLFKGCAAGKCSYTPLLRQACDQHQVRGELYSGIWFDIGTPDRLAKLQRSFNP